MKKGVHRSPLFYVGDKYKLMREISAHFPNNIGRLIEPFVGGGSVFMNTPAKVCLANDIDSYVIAIHRMLCGFQNKGKEFLDCFFSIVKEYGLSLSYKGNDVPAALKEKFPKTYFAKFNKDGYAKLKADFNKGGCEDMVQLYVLLIYGFNRMLRFNRTGQFNLPVGNVDFNQNTYNALIDYFEIAHQKELHFSSLDFRDFLNGIEYRQDDLIYLDPPYLITFSEYNKLWNEETEMDLLGLLDKLSSKGVRFAISNVTHYKGKTNDIFLNWAKQYSTYPIKSNYISYHDNTAKQFNEVLITNY